MGIPHYRIAITCAAALTVAGCGSLLPGQGTPPQIYSLTVPASEAVATERGTASLVVEEPDAPREIDTDRIVLNPSPVEVSYYKDARWSDRAPRLMQTLLVDALDGTGAFEFVGRDAGGLISSYVLRASLAQFQTSYESGRPIAHIKLKLSLIERLQGRVLASTTLASDVEAKEDSVRAVVIAFDEADAKILNEATAWTLAALPR